MGRKARNRSAKARASGRRTSRPARLVGPLELRLQRQQPGPAVGPLEAAAERPLEIGELARDVGLGEGLVQARADLARARPVREQPEHPRQQPVAVHARVPVETAVEDRMQLARRLRVLGAGHHVVELVGVLAADVAERQPGEAGGEVWRQEGIGVRRGRSRASQNRKTRAYIKRVLIPSRIRPVGAWARMTPFSTALRSGSSSRTAGTTL